MALEQDIPPLRPFSPFSSSARSLKLRGTTALMIVGPWKERRREENGGYRKKPRYENVEIGQELDMAGCLSSLPEVIKSAEIQARQAQYPGGA